MARKRKNVHRAQAEREADHFWIADAIKRPGALRRKAKVKKGQKIPAKTMEKLRHSKNPRTRRQANLAKTLKSFHH